MINITEKKKWEIAENLSQKIDLDTWEPFAAAAGISKTQIEIKNTAIAMCLSIVEGANNQDKLPDLLKAVVNQYKDQLLIDILNELENGYKDKLEKLAGIIEREQCILFLGPGILKVKDDKKGTVPFHDVLIERIQRELNNATIYFDPKQKDNLTYLVQRYYKIRNTFSGQAGYFAASLFEEYAENGQVDESVFQKLLKIPWKLIVNVNPDNILAQMMNDKKADSCLERKYSFANNSDDKNLALQIFTDIDDVKKNKKSFFYNLFGTFDEPENILFTESDFLEFITNVEAKTPQMHTYVNNMFGDKTKYYLFLGFDFDQWYFKIFARTLKLHETSEERALSLNISLKEFNECNIDFFEQKFKFYFVNEDIDKFLSLLIKSYNENNKK